MPFPLRPGNANGFYVAILGGIGLLALLGVMLYSMGNPSSTTPSPAADGDAGSSQQNGDLLLYCAAGIRPPVEQIAADYEREYGVKVQLMYGGSNSLLSQIEIAKVGDLYLAADQSYIELAQKKGLVRESLPLAVMKPVIMVKKGNPKKIQTVDDLLRDDVRTALGNPDQAAIGKTTRTLLLKSGHWKKLEKHVTQTGVFKPTVPEVANDVKLGVADAAVVWDTTLALYPDCEAVSVPEFDLGVANIAVGVLSNTPRSAAALRFARYMAASDKGQKVFQEKGYSMLKGDPWVETPELTFFCGSVNRRAVEGVIKAFEEREGVRINTVYNGCGILTGTMKTIHDQNQTGGFPDVYMACDRYYLDSVEDWFQEDVDISDTSVVIAVPKGNPGNIQSLQDLTKPGLKIAMGQPEQCTIGAITRQLLEAHNVYDEVMENVVTQTATSALLVPTVTTRSVDAALAYATDTLPEASKIDTIFIESNAAKAVQPFAIARSSEQKQLARRFYAAIAAARDPFESAGFHFRIPAGKLESPSTTP
ncbi:molybdate ABC transporter substrate-binding protein [Lignipirellula cremea]|nr:molybdate ABC transporter substrate-binding protein [Lignipirellula cremea]